MDTHQPVDLLEGREANTLADLLRAHPGTEIVCRDRAGAYAEVARRGAPNAVQVADRWHLWHNLAEAVEKTVALHRTALREPEPDTSDTDADAGTDNHTDNGGQAVIADTAPAENPLVIRTRERYAAVQDLLAGGETIAAICRQLSLDRKTVQRHARAEHVDELLGKARSRGACWTGSSPTCTNASTPGAPTPPSSPRRSPSAATGAATRPCAATCTPSAPRWSPHRRHRSHPPCGGSPAGSPGTPTRSPRTTPRSANRSWRAAPPWMSRTSTSATSPRS